MTQGVQRAGGGAQGRCHGDPLPHVVLGAVDRLGAHRGVRERREVDRDDPGERQHDRELRAQHDGASASAPRGRRTTGDGLSSCMGGVRAYVCCCSIPGMGP